MDRSQLSTFIGVDLGGGKGRTTAVAVLHRTNPAPGGLADGVTVSRYDVGGTEPWFDERLVSFLREQADGAVLAIDAPLTLTTCVRCREPVCPGLTTCVDPTVAWFRARAATHDHARGKKPLYTPYTQRATEVYLHDEEHILPRETLGQGMGPLTARAAHLVRALGGVYTLNDNLLEVYPKATIWKLFGEDTARSYKRHHAQQDVRLTTILEKLPGLRFGPGQWREFGVQNDHMFDAVLCGYTAWLWARDGWQLPEADRDIYTTDGWIWHPPGPPPQLPR